MCLPDGKNGLVNLFAHEADYFAQYIFKRRFTLKKAICVFLYFFYQELTI